MRQTPADLREWSGASHEARTLRPITPNPRGLPVEAEATLTRKGDTPGAAQPVALPPSTRPVARRTDPSRGETPRTQPAVVPAARTGLRGMEPFEVDPALLGGGALATDRPADGPPAPPAVRRSPALQRAESLPEPPPAVAPTIPGVASAPPLPRDGRAISAPPPLTKLGDPTLEVEADRIDGTVDQIITATGQAYVRKGWDELFGDVLRWNMTTKEASGEGNIVKRDRDSEVTGTRFAYSQESSTGKVDDASFSIASMDGKGSANTLTFDGPGRYAGRDDVKYTTCDFNDPDWLLKADSVEIDENTNEGVAKNARILAGGKVPLFYTPRFQFALSQERKSGFLTPSVSVTSRTGPQVFVPYYWNIASNMDATITPRYMALRGLQVGALFRYLEEDFVGAARAEYMPQDDVLGKQRWAFALNHSHRVDDRTSAYLRFYSVSDDAYFRDLTNRISSTGGLGGLEAAGRGLGFSTGLGGNAGGLGGTSTRLLPQTAGLNYVGDNWNLSAKVQSFQVLQDADAANKVVQPYQAVPDVRFNSQRLLAGLADARFDASFSSFSLRYVPLATDPTRREGERFILNPSIGVPIRSLWGFVEPRVSLHNSYYTLAPATANLADPQNTFSRSIPTLSLDSGLLFERQLSEAGAVQTFEPRLFYAYTPYRDQSRIPAFDTGRYDFNFAEIFSANRFVGQDRIGDANQVTAGVTTRYIDEKGTERLKATLAQRYTLSNLRVGEGDLYLPTDAPKKGVSDILGEFSGRILDHTSLISRVQYSPETSDVQKALVALRYNPELGKVINLGYRYTREVSATQLGLQQVDLSAQWPITGNLYALARTNYSILDKRQTEGLLGLEYYGSCWSLRAVVQNLALTANTSTKALFILLELKGIAGTDPSDYNMILSRNIGGYSRVDYDQNRTTEALFQ